MGYTTALKPLVKPSIPSGFRSGPRPSTGPGENAPDIAPTKTKAMVSQPNHLQRLLGSLPVGNSRYANTPRPMMIGRIQVAIQANAPPAGSESGCANRV